MKTKQIFSVMFKLSMFALAIVVNCLCGGVAMAVTADLPDAGKTSSDADGDGTATNDGIATETGGRANGDPEFYTKEIDKKITKIRPMATPIDQISRYAEASHSDSFVVKYYSVGTRPMKCTLKTAVTAQTAGESVKIEVDDPSLFTLDDTIRVVGVQGVNKENGTAYTAKDLVPDLELCVCGRDPSSNMPVVYAVNGKLNAKNQPIWLPDIKAGTTLVRMGKACGELDVQTGRFNNIPTAKEQYCQNFMIQVEQSTFDKIAAKEVDWKFTDLEEDGIYDMRLAQEESYLFGVKNKIEHTSKNGMSTWFTDGIWWQAGKDIEVGTYDTTSKTAIISDDDLVDISKDLFVGTGIGNKTKILLCGSDMLAAFSKIKSEKFRLKDTVEAWNLKFKSWETDFGEILTIHHELFDLNGMSDYGFALDPTYLCKKTHLNWTRNVLDLQKAGIRKTDAVVLQEVACLYLRYPKAHARLRLAHA